MHGHRSIARGRRKTLLADYSTNLGELLSRRQSEAALRSAKVESDMASRTKSEFLANMSHELRTPLNAIIGFSEVMNGELFGPMENERYKDYVGDIHKSSSHLLSLINDILDLSKIEADRYELYEEELDVLDAVASCERMMRHRADEAGVNLTVTVDDGLPLLMADKRALRQIMLNLVSNAVKFTPKGGSIRLAAFLEPDQRMAFRVTDTGVGMAKKDIPIALEPFRQIGKDSNIYSTEGTGLGLSISQQLINQHRGLIECVSEPGDTHFSIYIPLD